MTARRFPKPATLESLVVRIAVLCWIVLWAQACTTWRPVALQPGRFTAGEHPREFAVKVAHGAVVTIAEPVIVGDSLIGRESPHLASLPARPDLTQRLAVALSDVREIKVADGPKTAFPLVGVSVTVIGAYELANWFAFENRN